MCRKGEEMIFLIGTKTSLAQAISRDGLLLLDSRIEDIIIRLFLDTGLMNNARGKYGGGGLLIIKYTNAISYSMPGN
jgi:hypothetical protein